MTTNQTLKNRYRLEEELGQGGMGTVYKGFDTLLGRTVAIKLLTSKQFEIDSKERLLGEARAVAKLNHPNIVSIFDAGESENIPFIVMEYIEGNSLQEKPPQDIKDILIATDQVCSALNEAHSHGIIHRDLKPDNVIRTPRGIYKLTDFGLAQSIIAHDQENSVLEGTVFYISPEQAMGKVLDGRSDLYSLGVILFEFITGELPFRGDDPLEVVAAHINNDPKSLREYATGYQGPLEGIVLKLLSKNPDDRYQTASELQFAIKQPELKPEAAQRIRWKHNLPEEMTSFIGREGELKKVIDLLDSTRMLTLTGVGGTGKSRLAYQAARRIISNYPDGIWMTELASINNASLIVQAIAKSLNIHEQKGKDLLTVIMDDLRDRKLLLIMDNCEHLIRKCSQTANHILTGCPRVKILATSRESLGISGETTYYVPSMHVPALSGNERNDIWQIEAMRLFHDRAVLVKPDFSPGKTETEAIARICQRLDGLPLAIELAAARMRLLPAEEIAARLSESFRLLTGGSKSALPRQQTLRALIDWSFDLLTEDEKILFRRLSVFSNGWTISAAEEVCAEGALQKEDILDLLARLTDKSIILPINITGEARYKMLETMRQYAREKLMLAGEILEYRNKHLFYFTRLVEKISPRLWRNEQVKWMDYLELEHENLRASLEWSVGGEKDKELLTEGARIAIALLDFWKVRGYWVEAQDWVTKIQGNQNFKIIERAVQANLLQTAGNIIIGMGDLNKAEDLLNQALLISRSENDAKIEAYALLGLGTINLRHHFVERAENYIERSQDLLEKIDDKYGLALVYSMKGRIAADRGKYDKARTYFNKNLKICRGAGHSLGIAGTLVALGNIEVMRGDSQEGRKYLEESLSIFRRSKDKSGMAGTLSAIGLAELYAENLSSSLTHFQEVLRINRELRSYPGMGEALIALGEISRTEGDNEAARSYYVEAEQINEDLGQTGIVMVVSHNLGYVEKKLENFENALKYFRKALDLAVARDHDRFIYFCVVGIASVYIDMGDYEQGGRLLSASEVFSKDQDYKLDPIDHVAVTESTKLFKRSVENNKRKILADQGARMTSEDMITLAHIRES